MSGEIRKSTDCSVQELVRLLEVGFVRPCGGGCLGHGQGSSMPIGLIVNDLGAFFINEQSAEAESALADLLVYQNDTARFTAYCYLKLGADRLTQETQQKLAEFQANPANAELLKEANQRLATEA